MELLSTISIAYLIICAVIFVGLVLYAAYEDLTLGRDYSGRYALADRDVWVGIFALSCPILHLYIIYKLLKSQL